MAKSQFNLESLDVALDTIGKHAVEPTTKRAELFDLINRSVVEFTSAETSMVLVQNTDGDLSIVGGEGNRLHPKLKAELFERLRALGGDNSECRQFGISDKMLSVSGSTWQGWVLFYVAIQPANVNKIDQKLTSDLVNEISFQIRTFEQHRATTNQLRIQKDILSVTQLIKNLGIADSVEKLAYIFTNDLLVMAKASRISFVLASGKVVAVSSVSNFSKRTKLIRTISKLGKLIAKRSESIVWPDESFDEKMTPQDRKAQTLLTHLGAPFCLVIPLRDDRDKGYAALVIEYFQEQKTTEFLDRRLMLEDCASFSSPMIYRMLRLFKIPGIRWFDWLFNRLLTKPIRLIAKLGFGLMLIIGLVYLLFVWQRPFELTSQGVLKPSNERYIFSPEVGNVKRIRVIEGSKVEPSTMVIELESSELEQKMIELDGELAEIRQRLKDLEVAETDSNAPDPQAASTRLAAEIEVLKIRQQTQEQSYKKYLERKQSLKVFSPIEGQITTPNLKQRLTARPLNRGDIVMTVADMEGPWELELLVPDRKIDYLIKNQDQVDETRFNFRLASDPEKTFVGILNRIDFRADDQEQAEISFVKVYVDVEEAALGDLLRMGTRVYGNFDCGKRNLFFLLTYELRDSLREWLFF